MNRPEDKRGTVRAPIEADRGIRDQIKSDTELPMLSPIWPFKEGPWGAERFKSTHYRLYLLYQLQLVLQAALEFDEAYEKYKQKAHPELERFLKQQLRRVEKTKSFKAFKPKQLLLTEEDMAEMLETIRPWVNKWCVGSDQMLLFIHGFFTLRGIAEVLGMRETDFVEDGKPSKKLVNFVMEYFSKEGSEDLGWCWKALYTDESSKKERSEARERLLDKEHDIHFERIRESTLIFAVWCWVRVTIHVPGVLERLTEEQLADELRQRYEKSQEPPYQLLHNISKLIAPVDEAVGYERLPGRQRGHRRLLGLKLPNGVVAKIKFPHRSPRKI